MTASASTVSPSNAELGWEPDPGSWGLRDVVALSVWTLAIVLFFWKAVSLAEAFFYFDVTEINYPYRDFLAKEIKLGRFSRWFPGLYCGLPLYSESQAGYWHPLKYLLYPWMETWKAFNLDTVLSVWLTGVGTYGWLRRRVGSAGALTGAALFGLSGFVWAHLIHTSMTNALVSVPLVIWGLETTWDNGRWRGAVLGALALACQVFAGHLQDTLLTGALVGVYALYRGFTEPSRKQGLKAVGVAVVLVGLGVAIAAVQWIPSKELLDRSPRAGGLTHDQLTYGSWHPELLPTLAVREAYGTRARDTDWMDGFYPYHEMNAYLGLIGLALAVVGCGASRDRWVGFWLIVALLGSLLMLGKFTFLFDQLHRVPILGSSRIPVRFHLWVSLAIAALAAVGVDRLSKAGPVRLRWGVGFALLIVAASIPLMIHVYGPVWNDPRRWTTTYHLNRFRWLGRELSVAFARTALLSTLAFLVARVAARSVQPKTRRNLAMVLPLLVIADLLGSHWQDAPTIAPSYWTEPPESAKTLKADPSLQRIFGVPERSAGEPGYASERVNFLASRDPLAWSLAPVWGISSTSGETPIIPRRMLAYTDNAAFRGGRFDVDGVSHIVAGLLLSNIDKAPRKVGSVYIHRNPTAQPRARLMGRPIYASGEIEAAGLLKSVGVEMLKRLIVEDPERPLAADGEAIPEASMPASMN